MFYKKINQSKDISLDLNLIFLCCAMNYCFKHPIGTM